jgi:hypothetical protein
VKLLRRAMARIDNEPVLLLNLVQAVLIGLAAWGLDISKEQMGAALLVSQAVLAIAARAEVSPVESNP